MRPTGRRSPAQRDEGASRHPALPRAGRFVLPLAALVAAAALSGCGSISQKFADTASQAPGIGLPSTAPERPSTPPAYPAVHDIPAPRNSITLTNFEQQKLEDDLVSARDSQQTSVGIATQAKKLEKEKAEKERLKQAQKKIIPVSSSRSIY